MGVRTSAGTTIGIVAGQPATYNAAGYDALVFVPIGEVTDLGEFGREYQVATHNPLATRGTVKKKGSYNEGQIQMQVGLDEDDAGQTLAEAAAASDDDYSFCITTQSGAKYYFQAQVTSFKTSIGGVDQITAATIGLELTTSTTGVGVVKKPAP